MMAGRALSIMLLGPKKVSLRRLESCLKDLADGKEPTDEDALKAIYMFFLDFDPSFTKRNNGKRKNGVKEKRTRK